MSSWYPSNKTELNKILNGFLSNKPKIKLEIKDIHGLIVPHAGYEYSGEITGKAFSLLKNKKINKAIVFGPSHYKSFRRIATLEDIRTPLGKVNLSKNSLLKIPYEHSIENQIPFLQKINLNIEIFPIVVGQITLDEANQIANQFLKEYDKNTLFIFSTDLSHFLEYKQAVKKDNETIDIITKLDESRLKNIDACGIYPLLILFQMCKIKSWKPLLIEYKNSGEITGDKSSVVGYSSLVF